jgi:hypothetical protein
MSEPLFDKPTTFEIPATSENFVARDHFTVSLRPGRVRIVYVLGNFERWFLEKVEPPFSGSKLLSRELQRDASDAAIVAELGGEQAAETTLTEIFALMSRQPAGGQGFLASNGWGNNFYVRDVAGALRVVDVHWCDDGWGIEAASIKRIAEWPIRDRVLCRI